MPKYKVTLSRSYFVSIHAPDKERALRLTEYYVDTGKDGSSQTHRDKDNFAIEEIGLAYNEASEIVEI